MVNFPTTGLAHSSKSGSRNWSWFPGAPGETNSVIVLDILFPLPRAYWDQTLWFLVRTKLAKISVQIYFWPASLTRRGWLWRRVGLSREKNSTPRIRPKHPGGRRAPLRKFLQKESNLDCNLISPACLLLHWMWSILLNFSPDLHALPARVCNLCTIIHNFQTDWAKSFRAQPKSTAWQVGARTWSVGGRSFIGRLSCFPFEWLSALCVSPAWMHCCTKIKINSLAGKRLNESSIPVKYTAVPN